MLMTLAYLAGAMDSDGCFSIKKSTYRIRVSKDSANPTYSERLSLKQVTPQIPELLKKTFGGTVNLRPSQTENGKPLYVWVVTDKVAAGACGALLPYLLVKRQQAELVSELRESKENKYRKFTYWFVLENPEWERGEMVVASEAMKILAYSNRALLSQAVGNKSLLALAVPRGGHKEHARFPIAFLNAYAAFAATSADNRGRRRPPQLIAWRERLWQGVRELNKIGINGTPVYHRTGPYTMA